MMDPDIPKKGFFDSIDLVVPEGCCLNPPKGTLGRGRHAPPGNRGRRGDREGAVEGGAGALLSADLQDGHADGDLRHQPADRTDLHRPFGRHVCRVLRRGEGQDGWGAMNVSFGNLIRAPPPRSTSRSSPCASSRATTTPTRRRRRVSRQLRQHLPEAGAHAVDRSTRTSSARSIRCRASPAARRLAQSALRPRRSAHGEDPGHRREVGDLSERVLHEPGECYEYHYGGGGGWGGSNRSKTSAEPRARRRRCSPDEYARRRWTRSVGTAERRPRVTPRR